VRPVIVSEWLERVIKLESRLAIVLTPGPALVIQADSDQLEQLLINLLHNAVDAALETGGGVRVSWVTTAAFLEVLVEDDGPGLPNTGNLFVPFFTTKPGGSGIGLPLSRQIAENHGGSLSLENRHQSIGCLARLRLPL
jgi:signal transduction histidine kinase